jgi:hypothetical protein
MRGVSNAGKGKSEQSKCFTVSDLESTARVNQKRLFLFPKRVNLFDQKG